ncbi:MAG TPA: 3-deoxy-7-phosphoheptulonate synthase [Nitrospirae bacterium]|nr:3-deoxy-7-phosphoheptulonate synthase [Nitrospirota bacterium]
MAFNYIRKIPLPEEILSEVPLPEKLKELKRRRDEEIKAVFEGRSERFLLIIGPCSAHDEDAVCEYVNRLARLQEEVKDRIILIPRIYTNKPRTTGIGYKGMAHQPDPLKEPDIVEGIHAIRRMHIRAFSESHLTAADEMLYPGNYPYLEDILSYVAVGARSVENQQHRLTVSGLDVPAGMKNPTSGDLMVMLNSVKAAQAPHVFSYNGWEVRTTGNPHAHCILRGAVNQYGQNIPNYHYEDLIRLSELYLNDGYRYPAIIVDTNHANSNKNHLEQPRIALEVLESRRYSGTIRTLVKGLMIESYLEDGAQKPSEGVFGKSITDPCLGWEKSAELVRTIAERL